MRHVNQGVPLAPVPLRLVCRAGQNAWRHVQRDPRRLCATAGRRRSARIGSHIRHEQHHSRQGEDSLNCVTLHTEREVADTVAGGFCDGGRGDLQPGVTSAKTQTTPKQRHFVRDENVVVFTPALCTFAPIRQTAACPPFPSRYSVSVVCSTGCGCAAFGRWVHLPGCWCGGGICGWRCLAAR